MPVRIHATKLARRGGGCRETRDRWMQKVAAETPQASETVSAGRFETYRLESNGGGLRFSEKTKRIVLLDVLGSLQRSIQSATKVDKSLRFI